VKYTDIKRDDPRWSESERLIFEHLFRLVEKYAKGNRPLEAYGVKRAILTMACVLVALGECNEQQSPERIDL
jgi:hypothetical protein